jgi:hypothetical protein
MYGKEGHLSCTCLLLEVPDKNFVLYKIELVSSYRSVDVTVSTGASKLVVNNLNICLNIDDSTVDPMGRDFWSTMYRIGQPPATVRVTPVGKHYAGGS